MKLRLNCREATALLLQREDGPVTAGDWVALRLHLLICHGCTRFEGQVGVMRRAVDRWKHYRDSADWGEGGES